jgi:hypothetical protein
MALWLQYDGEWLDDQMHGFGVYHYAKSGTDIMPLGTSLRGNNITTLFLLYFCDGGGAIVVACVAAAAAAYNVWVCGCVMGVIFGGVN